MSITSSSVATPRAVLIGLALAITVNLFSLAGSYHVGYRNLTFGHIDFGLLIPFLIGVLGPNILLKFIRPSWGLRYPELLFVFCLGWIGFTVPAWGLLNYLVNIMVEAHYYVSPENQWRALFFPYLPDWVVISDGTGRPYRVRPRPPCFSLYTAFSHLIEGDMLANAVPILGSLNIIAGELDR